MTRERRRDEPGRQAEAFLPSATRLLTEAGVRRLYVVDAAGRLIGVASRRDLLSSFLRRDRDIRDEVQADVLRPHTEGYALNFYKSRGDLARKWSERSRQEILGYWPQFAFGNTVADRNTVARANLSGLRRSNNQRTNGQSGQGYARFIARSG